MNESNQLAVRYKMVRKANALIQRSRFSLTALQQRILLFLIAQISPEDDDFKTYIFRIPEFCRICGMDDNSGKNYQQLKDAIQGMKAKCLWVMMPDRKERLLSWISMACIDHNNGTIEIRLDEAMKPFLLQLRQNYTQYELIFTLYFRSKYSIRLYELIKSIHYHDLEPYRRCYSVDDLKVLLDGENYKEYRDFKRRVLVPSINEINASSDKNVTMEEIKSGRRTTHVAFIIQSKPSLEVLAIRDAIDRELGTDQISLWDEIIESGILGQKTGQ